MTTHTQRLREALEFAALAEAPETPEAGEPVASDSHDFVKRTNNDYAAWCRSYYAAESLDERGFMSLHGLWAWQEQERRFRAAPAPLVALTEAQCASIANHLAFRFLLNVNDENRERVHRAIKEAAIEGLAPAERALAAKNGRTIAEGGQA